MKHEFLINKSFADTAMKKKKKKKKQKWYEHKPGPKSIMPH